MIETKSAGGIITKGKLVIVTRQHNISWSLPKGHIEDGETKIEAAVREIYEETGITDLQLIKELGSYRRYKIDKYGREDKNELKIIHMFLFRTNQNKISPKDKENLGTKFVDKDKVMELLSHQKDKEFYLSVMNQI